MIMMFARILFILFLIVLAPSVYAADKNQNLSGKELKEAVQMNDIYARHMFSSNCLERQKSFFIPMNMSEADKAARIQSFQKSCDCMTNVVMKSYLPNDVIDYVTKSSGSVPTGSSYVRPKPDPAQARKFGKLMMLSRDKQLRQSCGFKQ